MEDGKSTVRAVDRALDILLCFISKTDWAMTEIAEQVGLHKSTVHRMLATLEEKGFIERDRSTDRYHLGLKMWELSAHLSRSDDQATIWLPEMERLRDQLGETVSIYVRDGSERIRMQAVQSNQPVRRVAPVGVRLPLYAGASSKVLIAYSDPIVQESILEIQRGCTLWIWINTSSSSKRFVCRDMPQASRNANREQRRFLRLSLTVPASSLLHYPCRALPAG